VASPGSSREVAAVTYAFSKITPQLPEYTPVFAAVAIGVHCNSWVFNRLEAGLIGTALVDVGVHLSDALPAVVRPAIQLTGGDKAMTIDELRYLVHACTGLPSPGIKLEEVEMLAASTQRLIGEANFAKAAHLAVSWLQIRAPAKAKQQYLDALVAVCIRVCGEKPTHPAHPVLIARISTVLGSLLAREGHRDPPPITPPLLRNITGALVQISRGLLSQGDGRRTKGQALDFADMVEIMHLVTDFCYDHGPGASAEASEMLPRWAAESLGFVIHHRPLTRDAEPDLQSLLTLLRLLRRYEAKPAPEVENFVWIAKKLETHEHTANDSVLLAEIVGELVPQLPPAQRARFARKLFSKVQELPQESSTQSLDVARAATYQSIATRQLFQDADSKHMASVASVAVAGVARPTHKALASTRSPPTEDSASIRAVGEPSQFRLWDRLSPQGNVPTQNRQLSISHARMSKYPVEAAESNKVSEIEPRAVSELEQIEEDDIRINSQETVDHLQVRLEQALRRVAVLEEQALKRVAELEAKLEEQSSGLRDDLEDLRSRTKATEVKVENMPRDKIPATEASAMPGLPAMPDLLDWSSTFTFPGSSTDAAQRQPGNSAGRATLHVRRPFDFDEFRRSQTQGLQNERLRVLVPPDPMCPLPRKF
jgi:hypothetical protein